MDVSGPAGRRTAQVVVIGGGPTGLAMAHCLGIWGVQTILVEQETAPSGHPRATLVNTRSMEIFRLLSVADAIRRAGVPLESSARVSWMTTMTGMEIGKLDIIDSSGKLMRLAAQSPTFAAICPQHRLERILASSLASRPSVEALFGYRAASITADPASVRVDLLHTAGGGPAETLTAEYAVLAEGLGGRLREQVGIALVTEPPLGRLLDIHFFADLRRWTRGRESALYWIVNPRVRGVVITVDPEHGEWLLEVPALTEYDVKNLFDEAGDYVDLVESAIGTASIAEISSVRTWSMGSTSVTSWRDATGRVLVAGDAAHTFPPTGGFGMNTGVQDAHNLSWKLAGVVQGWAAPAILHSYERERRPVAEFNGVQSERNALQMRDFLEHDAGPLSRVLAVPGDAGTRARAALAPLIEAQRPHFDFHGQALGFRYSRRQPPSAAVVPDIVDYTPSADVGARAPHVWLDGPAGRVSTCDLSQAGFALITCAEAAPRWAAAATRLRSGRRLPIRVFPVAASATPSGTLRDVAGAWRRAYGIGHATAAVLVRPDGHVAARLDGGDDAEEELERAANEVLKDV